MGRLFELVKNPECDIDLVSCALESEFIDAYDDEYKTPLYYAKNLNIVKFLLEKGANPNGGCHVWRSTQETSDIQNGLPIIDAIERRDHDKLRILLEKGADPDVVTTKGMRLRKKFLPSGCCYAITIAIEKKDIVALKMLFDFGAKVNLARECNPIVVARYTISMCRSESDMTMMLECFKLLLEKGAYVSLYDMSGVLCSTHNGLAYILAKHYVVPTIEIPDHIYYECLHNVLCSKNIELVKFFILLVKGSIDRKYILDVITRIGNFSRNMDYCKNVEELIHDSTFPTLFDLIDFKSKCEAYEVKVTSKYDVFSYL